MLIINLLGFIISCILLVKSSEFAVKSISSIARILKIGQFLISFVIVAFVTSLPETSVAIVSAINKMPEIGYGALIGSNIADLSLILGMLALVGRKINLKYRHILHESLFLVLILMPMIVAYDGVISNKDGIILITACILFLLHILKKRNTLREIIHHYKEKTLLQNIFLFILSMLVLFASANYIIKFTKALSIDLSIPTILIALVLIAIGTCLPELFFALSSIRLHHANLGLGDIIGTVIIDATLMLGITALIHPIILDPITVLVTGAFTILITAMVLSIIEYKKALTQREGFLFIFFYIIFVFVELSIRGIS